MAPQATGYRLDDVEVRDSSACDARSTAEQLTGELGGLVGERLGKDVVALGQRLPACSPKLLACSYCSRPNTDSF
jgi:hypothetical protein